jgi:hypothetical protein
MLIVAFLFLNPNGWFKPQISERRALENAVNCVAGFS